MKKIYISLCLLLLSFFVLLSGWWENFLVMYVIFLLITFAFTILTFYWDFSMIFEGYKDLSPYNQKSISFFLILLYIGVYTLLRVYLLDIDPKKFITLIFISQIPLISFILAELIRVTSKGSIKYLSALFSLFFIFLFSQKEISNYLTGAAGVLLISNMLFSTEFLNYMNTTKFKGEVLNKFNLILASKKDEWKVKINLLFISYSASIAIKNITPVGEKTKIIKVLNTFFKFEIDKWVIERMIIGGCLCICIIGIYIGLKRVLDGKWCFNTVSKFIDRQYKLLDK